MEITTPVFAGFTILAALGYQWLPRRIKNVWLLFACSVFVVSWSWQFLITLLLIAVFNYILGLLISGGCIGKIVLWVGIAGNLFALLVLKYSDFYLPALTSLMLRLGLRTGADGLRLLAPLGISFITVQMISYLIDVYFRRMQAERNVIKFSLYVLYFPKILAGPVERAKAFISRLDSPQEWSRESIQRSIALVAVGLVRKIVIADLLTATIPGEAFQHPSRYPASLLAVWLLAYAFALYNDFAGYTSLVRGISGFFGIDLTCNFNLPYFSRSFSEFWNRWHISLSNWLRDYIFFPLARALLIKIPDRKHIIHAILPPVLTMLVSGLWHGLAWNTLLWGVLQGCYLAVERIGAGWKPRVSADELPRWRQIISAIGVFLFILLAWVPFHSGVKPAVEYWQGLFSISNWHFSAQILNFLPAAQVESLPLAILEKYYLFLFFQAGIVLVLAMGLDLVQYKDEYRWIKWPVWLQGALLVLLAGVLFLLSFAEKGAPFIYQSF